MSRTRFEGYDPMGNVCANQDDFDQAVHAAIKYSRKKKMQDCKPWGYVIVVLWFICLVWALLLAMQVPAGHERVEHIVFGLIFSPVYIIAHYLGMFSKTQSDLVSPAALGFRFGMGGCSGSSKW